MRYIEHRSVYLSSLVAEALNGDLALPRFQRPFVWDDGDVCRFMDSLLRGYPVGHLLLWGGWWSGAQVPTERVRPFEGCASLHERPTLVIDGQQRVTALLRLASGPPLASRYVWCSRTGEVRRATADEFRDWREAVRESGVFPTWLLFQSTGSHMFDLYREAHPSEVVERTEVRPGPRGGSPRPVRVRDVVDLPRTPRQQALAEAITRAIEAQDRLRSVQVAATVIPPDATLDYAREVFRRLNTSGRPFSEEAVFAALASDPEG